MTRCGFKLCDASVLALSQGPGACADLALYYRDLGVAVLRCAALCSRCSRAVLALFFKLR